MRARGWFSWNARPSSGINVLASFWLSYGNLARRVVSGLGSRGDRRPGGVLDVAPGGAYPTVSVMRVGTRLPRPPVLRCKVRSWPRLGFEVP